MKYLLFLLALCVLFACQSAYETPVKEKVTEPPKIEIWTLDDLPATLSSNIERVAAAPSANRDDVAVAYLHRDAPGDWRVGFAWLNFVEISTNPDPATALQITHLGADGVKDAGDKTQPIWACEYLTQAEYDDGDHILAVVSRLFGQRPQEAPPVQDQQPTNPPADNGGQPTNPPPQSNAIIYMTRWVFYSMPRFYTSMEQVGDTKVECRWYDGPWYHVYEVSNGTLHDWYRENSDNENQLALGMRVTDSRITSCADASTYSHALPTLTRITYHNDQERSREAMSQYYSFLYNERTDVYTQCQ